MRLRRGQVPGIAGAARREPGRPSATVVEAGSTKVLVRGNGRGTTAGAASAPWRATRCDRHAASPARRADEGPAGALPPRGGPAGGVARGRDRGVRLVRGP